VSRLARCSPVFAGFTGLEAAGGALVARDDPWSDILEWRNELFEPVEGATAERLDGAQLHAPRSAWREKNAR
jgi:hypothetical protein